jgi:ATP phosphoribosyltransferase regulatory subunit
MTNGLLPEGMRDRLAPQADAAATLLRAVIDAISAHGYTRVQPPLAEFEEELAGRLKGTGQRDLFRLVDPVSARTLALRPDITAQISRMATTRLATAARPLRLGYGGQVLKLRSSQLRPEREMSQAGAELIGSDSVEAATEVVLAALEALAATGARGVTLDLTLPDLVETLAAGPMPLPADKIDVVRAALDAKDAGRLAALGATDYLPLLAAAGPLPAALTQLRKIDATHALEPRLTAIEAIARAVTGLPSGQGTRVTLDPTERHGFEYQSWLGFSLFCEGVNGEIGRGGSYTIVHACGREEAAIGFSLYLDPLVDAGLGRADSRRVFLPRTTNPKVAARLRTEGWITVAALAAEDDPHALGCSHILSSGAPVAL